MKKKLVSLMLVAAMTASLTACGSKKTEEPTSTVHKSITAAEYDAAITSDAAIYKKAFTMPEYKGIQVTVDKSVLNVAESITVVTCCFQCFFFIRVSFLLIASTPLVYYLQ